MEHDNIAQKGPFILDMQPGTYFWCACGHSRNQPFCDGSHKQYPPFSPVKEVITAARKVAWCGCKHSGRKPLCDGTHKTL